jgi:hypothetical protein
MPKDKRAPGGIRGEGRAVEKNDGLAESRASGLSFGKKHGI